MTSSRAQLVLAAFGAAVVVAFFLPFLDLGGLVAASGWDIVMQEGVPWSTRLLLAALPAFGLTLVAAGLGQSRKTRLLGVLFGVSVLGYLGWSLLRIFFATTGVGLWITIAMAFAAISVALTTRRG